MSDRQNNIACAFEHNSRLADEKTFLRLTVGQSARDYTFADIRESAFSYNAYFRKSGLKPGSVLAIILTHSVDLYSAFLGSMMAGLTPTIMPFPTPKQDKESYWTSHQKLFAVSGIGAIFTYRENLEDIAQYLGDHLHFVGSKEAVDFSATDERITHNEIAVLQHSSGTTALKKGVMLSHEAIFNQVNSYSSKIGLNSDSKIVTWLPLYHDMGFIACFLTPIVLGCEVAHLDAFIWSAKPTILLDEIERTSGEYVWLPNFAYNHIANSVRSSKTWDLSSVKAIINCSEPCKPETFAAFKALPQLINLSESALQVCYAMAENVFAVTQTDITKPPQVVYVDEQTFRGGKAINISDDRTGVPVLSCGEVIEGTQIAIVLDGVPCPGVELTLGEIAISGASLYSGYYKRPEITAKKLIDGWHHSGDVGFIYNGELFVTGRIDDLLIIRGKNIYAHEVEDLVNSLELTIPGRAVAFSVFKGNKGEAALVVMAESDDVSVEKDVRLAIRRAIEANFGVSLGDFKLLPPKSLRKTTSGKLSRSENSRLYLELI